MKHQPLLLLSKRSSILIFYFIYLNTGYTQNVVENIYKVPIRDSILSEHFINAICNAARINSTKREFDSPIVLEELILMASGSSPISNDQLVSAKSLKWHRKFGEQCYCQASDSYPAGLMLRQVVHSNFREFANIIGPTNRLPLDLTIKDPLDNMTILEYVNKQRIDIEVSHGNNRHLFQQDINWKNIMFFYFLFSEYGVR